MQEDRRDDTKQQRDPYRYQRISIRTQQGTYEQEDEEDIEIVRYKEKVKKYENNRFIK